MKTRGRFCTFALISLLSLCGIADDVAAQDYTLNQQDGSRKFGEKPGAYRAKMAGSASGYTYSVLYNFCSEGNCTDGANPYADLMQDAAGNLYGTTTRGGANTGANKGTGGGTVFKVDSAGHETVLYSFCSAANCTDGWAPAAGLIQDTAGNLYGTTAYGGANTGANDGKGGGTVFKVDSARHETVLHSFCSAANCTDGNLPFGGLIQDGAGNFYGTTTAGGAGAGGTVFKVDSTGHETVLHSFCSAANCTDGGTPLAGLIQDAAGNLYGTTSMGGRGTSGAGKGGGTVFKVDSTGHETVLYSFCSDASCMDGLSPAAGLIQDAAGNLYGTTLFGGSNTAANSGQGGGAVFKLANTGHETVLYNFCAAANCIDGLQPGSPLIQDAAGNLYGTTAYGGANTGANRGLGGGAAFKVGSTDNEIVLHSFCSATQCTDATEPLGGLIQDAAGNLYGTTDFGGANTDANSGKGGGAVFRLAASGGGGTATVTLTASPNPSDVDQSVIFSAVVSGSGATPTGSVAFKEGTNALGTVTLANGEASLTTTFLKSESVSIVVNYSGDKNYKASKSSPLTQVIKQYPSSTTLASSLNPSTYGQPVTLSATVSSTGPTPTGNVTFKNGSKSVGSETLSAGVAKLTTSKLPAGTLTITASYGGDAANTMSTSPALKQVVDKTTSATSIVSSVNPSTTGETVKFAATVTSPTTAPTGTVKFMDGTTELGTGTLAKSKASYSTSTLSAGSHKITAVYEGTANISGSTSPILTQTVK